MVNPKNFKHLGTRMILIAMLLLLLLAGFTTPARADDHAGGARRAVYTITNAADGNEVVVFRRSNDGSLVHHETVSTGGWGTGAGLGSQGAVILNKNGRWLFVVNAGSNQISVLRVRQNGLELTDVVDSGGVRPISLTIHNRILYVLNAGESGNISGFRLAEDGTLEALDGSTQPLSNGGSGDAPQPAQISFSPNGNVLVVTEKMTNRIDVYEVKNKIAGAPVTHDSAGTTPFGFAFDKRKHLIVSEAFGGAPNASALSSYRVARDTLETRSASVGTTQTAACWVVISKNGKYAYTTNAGSGSISSYTINRDGMISLLEAQAGLTGDGSSPIDMALSKNGNYLYAAAAASSEITIFMAQADGSLESLGAVNVPAGSLGLAAR
jgi:6-phosphogluconolactonase